MKQYSTICKTCPFRRDIKPGALGGSRPETYIGQAFGAFWLPCHEKTDYKNENWRTAYGTPQCVGAAIFRANAFPAERPPMILVLPENTTLVFASAEEFFAHHKGISLDRQHRNSSSPDPLFTGCARCPTPTPSSFDPMTYILCSNCESKMRLTRSDIREGFRERRISIDKCVCPNNQHVVVKHMQDGHTHIMEEKLDTLICDVCNCPVPDGNRCVAVTHWHKNSEEPGPWEIAYAKK